MFFLAICIRQFVQNQQCWLIQNDDTWNSRSIWLGSRSPPPMYTWATLANIFNNNIMWDEECNQYHQLCRLSLESSCSIYLAIYPSSTGWLHRLELRPPTRGEESTPASQYPPSEKTASCGLLWPPQGGFEVHQDKYLKTASAKTEGFMALSTSAKGRRRGGGGW